MSKTTIALTGNPNSGKTTTFNALTGSRQHVGNYPGVTVAKKEGYVKYHGDDLHVVDLPGTYSLTAYSADELAARDFLIDERPDVAVDIMDANTLERSLYLAVQLLEMGVPLALALNMMDEVRAKNWHIDTGKLSSLLGVPVIETVARHGEGKDALIKAALQAAEEKKGLWKPLVISYSPDIDEALSDMSDLIEKAEFLTDKYPARWLALKYIENDEQIRVTGRRAGDLAVQLEAIAARVGDHCKRTLNMEPEAIVADYRYGFIASLMKQGIMRRETSKERIVTSDKIDRVVTSTFFGPAFMLFILFAMFQITFIVGEIPMGWFEAFFEWLAGAVSAVIPAGLLQSLLVDGIIGGVGGVLGFVPLIVVMFIMLSFLEDLGYMARMAYMLDRVFKAFGLHGSSVMPFIISGGIPGGCAVPGVMAARTLRSPKERLATILTAPFMACGAKVPVFLLLAGAFFPESAGNALFWITLASWALALIVARILRFTIIAGPPTPFIMELPPYRMPTLRGVLLHTWERAWQYIKKAGTTILAISILLWAAMTFPGLPESDLAQYDDLRTQAQSQLTGDALEAKIIAIDNAEAENGLRHSFAGSVGMALEPVSKLAGFDWRTNIALIGGVAAKEVIVSTLGTAYSMGEIDPEETEPLVERLVKDPEFTTASAVALIIFTMLYAPCFVTVVTMARESSWGWAAFSVVGSTGLAFLMAVIGFNMTKAFM